MLSVSISNLPIYPAFAFVFAFVRFQISNPAFAFVLSLVLSLICLFVPASDFASAMALKSVLFVCYFVGLNFELVLFSIMPENKRLAFSNLPLVKTVLNKKFNRAKLFEVNKSAIIFDTKTRDKSRKNLLAKGFDFIEIPKGFTNSKIDKLTSEISSLAIEKGIKDFNISLRIKKLGLYQTKGFYSKETNTMFLDPRHLDVWRHELAHYFVVKTK